MASTLGGNKARVSVQERIKQLIEQGVPLTEATDQAHREAVAATELMFPTTEGDGPLPGVTTAVTFGDAPTHPLPGVTTATTFGDGSTGTSAGPSPYFQLGEKIDVQSHSDWMKARRQALDELNRKYDASAGLQKPIARADDPGVLQKPINRLEGVSEEAKQEILDAGGEVTPSVDVEERPTDPIRAGDPPEDAEREFAGAGISDPTLALDDFYPEMPDVDQQALVRALLSGGQQPTGIALPEQAGGQRIPRLLELLGGIGGQIAQSRAIGSSNRANAARQARANLQSALRGGGGGAAFQETPKVGLLGHLATGLKGLGTGLQDVRTDEVAAEQADFENLIKQRELGLQAQGRDADLIRAQAALHRARNPRGATTKSPDELFEQEGANLFLQDVPREQVEARLRENPVYADMLNDYPDLLGQAYEGHEKARTGDLTEAQKQAAEGRAALRSEQATKLMGEKEEDRAIKGYESLLRGKATVSAHSKNPFSRPEEAFAMLDFDRMSPGGQLAAMGAYAEAHGLWYEKNAEVLKADREKEREKRKELIEAQEKEMKKEQETFKRMEGLRKSLQAQAGVKAFSGIQGIGGAYQRMDGLYKRYVNDPGEGEARGAFQNAIVQNFQRMIDPATVRLGDIDLIVASQSAWARFKTSIIRVTEGGFVDDSLLREMHRVAGELHDQQRKFVEEEVDGAVTLWNGLHLNNSITPEVRDLVVNNILGGDYSDDHIRRLALKGNEEAIEEARKRGLINATDSR